MTPSVWNLALIRTTLILALAAVTGVLLAGCGEGSSSRESGDAPPSDERVTAVSIQAVTLSGFTERIQVAGVVKAYDDVTLSAEEGGVLRQWKVEKGQMVQKGEVVALLKDDVLKPAYLAAQAQFSTADLNFQKQEKVFQEAGVSELQYRSAQYARDGALAQAELAKARWERASLRSPVAGILDEKFVDEGEMAAPGLPVARIVNIDRVRIQVNVPERHAGSITRGTPLSFSVLAYPGQSFTGKISVVGSTVSPDNRTFQVEAVVSNPGRKLKPDMIARTVIAQPVARKALLVDEAVVQQIDEGTTIVFVEVDGKARQRVVVLGLREENKVEILSGLVPGDRVIVTGFRDLVDGQKVLVTQ